MVDNAADSNFQDAIGTPAEPGAVVPRAQRIQEREAALRTTLDHPYTDLAHARAGLLRTRLEALNFAAARLATRVNALHTALEPLLAAPAFAPLVPALLPALTALGNTTRTVALAVVSRQPAHLATAEVRLRRLANLLRVLESHEVERVVFLLVLELDRRQRIAKLTNRPSHGTGQAELVAPMLPSRPRPGPRGIKSGVPLVRRTETGPSVVIEATSPCLTVILPA